MFHVSISSGELCLTLTAFSLPGPMPVPFTYAYSSSSRHESSLGEGWTVPWDVQLAGEQGAAVLQKDGVNVHRFEAAAYAGAADDTAPYQLQRIASGGWLVTERATLKKYRFDGDGLPSLAGIEDRWGNSLTFHRSRAGVVLIRDSIDRTLQATYDGRRLHQIVLTRHAGVDLQHVLFEGRYDREGRLATSIDWQGAQHRYQYEGRYLVAYTNPLGGTYYAAYNGDGQCVRTWEQGGRRLRSLEFDARRRTTLVGNSLGLATLYRFNENGALIERIDPIGGVTRAVLDAEGRFLGSLDPTGQPRVLRFRDNAGRWCMANGAGATIALEIDARGRLVAAVDARGNRWEYGIDEETRTASVTTPSGHTWGIEFDERGTIARTVDPDGEEQRYHLSRDGREENTWDGATATRRKTFDSLGRLRSLSTPRDGSELTVEYRGRARRIVHVDGSERIDEYDAMGNLLRVRDEVGSEWAFEYDAYGRLLSRTDPLRAQIRFEYDTEGRAVAVITERGGRFESHYDALGWISSQRAFDGSVRRFEYDGAGRIVAFDDGTDQRVAITCDPLGNPTSRLFPDGRRLDTAYDTQGRIVAADDFAGTAERTYDAEGRLVREASGSSEILYEYGWRGVPLRISAAGRVVSYSYERDGRLRSLAEGDEIAIAFASDDSTRTRTIRFDSGVTIERVYNARQRLASQVARTPVHGVVLSEAYAYDGTGNLTGKDRVGRGALAFHHNRRGELVEVRRGSQLIGRYDYDPAGNRIVHNDSRSDFDVGNRLVQSMFGSYTYDAAGRPTARRSRRGSLDCEYDAIGRLHRATVGSGSATSFTYDAFFRRVEKASDDGRRHHYVWTDDLLFQEVRPDGALIRYLNDPVDRTPVAVAIGAEWYGIATDHRGEATDLIRLRDGMLMWSSEPVGFHAEGGDGVDGVSIPLRGPGQQYDPETGLVYNRARYYDPREGRFWSIDPIGIRGGWNLYRFCLNRPVHYVDPLGLATCSEAECDADYDSIQQQMGRVQTRWNEMNAPARILPWTGAPPVGTPYAAPAVAADGTAIAAGDISSGSVTSHIEQYDNDQRGLGNRLNEYYRKGCPDYHGSDPARQVGMQQAAEWSVQRPELPTYPQPPAMPDFVQAGLL